MADRLVLHLLPHPGEGGERYVDLLEAMPGFRFERFYMSHGRGPAEALGRVRPARLAAADAELVHLHGDAVAILCGGLIGRRPGVITFHGMHLLRRSSGARRRALEIALRRALRRSRAAICQGNAELADARAIAGEALAHRLVVIENGIPLPPARDPGRRQSTRAELGLGGDEVVVVFAGQLERRKGVLDLLVAIRDARGRGAPLRGLICGDGPLRDEVSALASAAGSVALGRRADIDRIYEAADIGALPSEREGMSLSVLEQMGWGLAMVVSDGPGNPEAIGDAGLVIPYGEPSILAGALAELAADPGRRERLGAAARERVRTSLNADRMVTSTREVYERVLAGPG